MSNKLKNNRKREESVLTAVRQFLGYLLDGMICIYMLLVIVVMPFYNEQGFAYIGTNKAFFFRSISVNGAKFILPVVALHLILWGIEKSQERKRKSDTTSICTIILQFCRTKLSLTDIFALLYGASLLLSYGFSDYREHALWGADGWYMGLLPQLTLLAIYFIVSRFWTLRNRVVFLFLPVSAVVFLLGYLNRFGIFPIDMKNTNPSFLSTIGNINWYCGYLVSVFFGGYYLFWQSGRERKQRERFHQNRTGYLQQVMKILLVVYVAVGFATLVTQGSLSGIVTLAVMLVVTFCLSTNDGRRMLAFWQEMLILSVVCLATWCLRTVFPNRFTTADTFVDLLTHSSLPIIATVVSLIFVIGIAYCNAHNAYPAKLLRWVGRIVGGGAAAGVCVVIGMIVVNTLHPGSIGALSENPYFTFSSAWGSGRGATWEAGYMCFTEQNWLHKLIGVGPDAMEAFLYQNGSDDLISLVKERFGTSRLTNAHCEWLTILVNEGLLGIVSFVGMMVSGIVRFMKRGMQSKVIAGACGFCLLAYTVNNFFSFQQSMSVATIFVIFGIGEAYARAYASPTIFLFAF